MKIYVFLTLFISFLSFSQEKTIEVIAVEYPPFTTLDRDDDGLAFKLLRKKIIEKGFTWQPLFLPPGRAIRVINSDQWCASFYPPTSTLDYSTYILDENSIQIGLVRKKQVAEFSWESFDDIKRFKVGLLRSDKHSVFIKSFTDAGIHVFFLESVDTGVKMVLADRLDYAILDNITFDALSSELKNKLQLSTTHLLETQISIHINNKCTVINNSFK